MTRLPLRLRMSTPFAVTPSFLRQVVYHSRYTISRRFFLLKSNHQLVIFLYLISKSSEELHGFVCVFLHIFYKKNQVKLSIIILLFVYKSINSIMNLLNFFIEIIYFNANVIYIRIWFYWFKLIVCNNNIKFIFFMFWIVFTMSTRIIITNFTRVINLIPSTHFITTNTIITCLIFIIIIKMY